MANKYSLLWLSLIVTLGIFAIIMVLMYLPSPFPLIPKEYVSDFVFVLPGTIFTDMPMLFVIPIGVLGLVFLSIPVIFKFMVYIHKLIMRGAEYGFAQLGADIKPAMLLRRAFIISLFAFNMSAIIVGLGYGELFRDNISTADPSMNTLNEAEAVIFGSFLLASAGLVIFLPLWIAEDSGLVMYRLFPDQRRTPEIAGIHALYLNLWKALISASTFYTLWEYIVKSFSALRGIDDPAIFTPIMLCLLPFITIGLVSIPTFLYEKYLPRIKNRVSNGLQNFHLPDIQIPGIMQIGIDRIKVD